MALRLAPRIDGRQRRGDLRRRRVGTAARAGLAEALPHSADQLAVADVPGQRRGRGAAGVLRHPAAGTTAVVQLPAPHCLGTGLCGGLSTFSTMQVEIVRMIDAAAPICWPWATRRPAWPRGICALQLASGTVRRVRMRPMNVLVWVGVILIGGAGRCCGSSSTAPCPRGPAAPFPRHHGGQPQRRADPGPAHRGGVDRAPRCSPAPPRSARTPPSPPGCWKSNA